ncbi:MAG: hypothetical protein LBQ30_02055 [Treponema sp.]|jgi:hypothetical protein|nr:hypothetical protein [Treponema sp.]
MRGKVGFVFIGFMLILINSLNAQMSKSQLQQMYVTYLREQGYQTNVDSDGDVTFKAEGYNFYIVVDEDDLESFRIVFPNFWEIESTAERVRAYEAAMYATRTTKVASVYITSRDNTSIDANIFVGKPEDFKLHFRRMIDVILIARRDFIDKM